MNIKDDPLLLITLLILGQVVYIFFVRFIWMWMQRVDDSHNPTGMMVLFIVLLLIPTIIIFCATLSILPIFFAYLNGF